MISGIDRVYVNARARTDTGLAAAPRFPHACWRGCRTDDDIRSPLAREIGSKGYHDRAFRDGPYPLE